MTTRYVGKGGNDGNDGLTWANRKLTLNGVEDTPVVAGDTVYVGAGTYRELFTADVAGGSSTIITYIGDVTGEHTDGVGGIVRITGSDNDTTATRAQCILNDVAYRTFRGFTLDTPSTAFIGSNGNHMIVEDCVFQNDLGSYWGILIDSLTQSTCIIRRCVFIGINDYGIQFAHDAQVTSSGHLVENCLFISVGTCIASNYVEGITVKNCTLLPLSNGIFAQTATGGLQFTVYNCILVCANQGFYAANTNQITENYNAVSLTATPRTNTNTGANSNTYHPLFNSPVLLATAKYPYDMFALSPESPLRAIAGTSESTDDLYGFTRPTTSAKKSWGAIQYMDVSRDTTTKRTGTASIKIADAGLKQIIVPVTNESTTISVYAYREANYAGTNPQMIIRQPGQSARTSTDAGSASSWNQLTDTFTPAASPPYVIVELVSNNTATSGSYAAYFDDLVVS